MADHGLFIGWGRSVPGREQKALEVFNQAGELWSKWQEDDRIESFEIVLIPPHGGDLYGFALLRGEADQLSALRDDDEFIALLQRAGMIVDALGVVNAYVGRGVSRVIGLFQQQIAEMG